jgi:hypothetical protein
MTQDEYAQHLRECDLNPNSITALLNAYKAGADATIERIKKRKKNTDATYQRNPTITNYARKLEAGYILSVIERPSA